MKSYIILTVTFHLTDLILFLYGSLPYFIILAQPEVP